MKKFIKNNKKIVILSLITIIMGVTVFKSNIFSVTTKSSRIDNDDTKAGYNYSNNSQSSNTTPPSVKYKRSINLNLFEELDPYKDIQTNGEVTVLYNNVDNTKVGNYIIEYSICDEEDENVCRYISVTVLVRDWNKQYTEYEEYDSTNASDVKWGRIDNKKCQVGSTNCSSDNIELPVATDSSSNEELEVNVISDNVNINRPGIYYIIYQADNSHGVSSTRSRQVQIYDNNKYDYDNLNEDYTQNIETKKIDNYEWVNKVEYLYKCVNTQSSDASAWQYVSTKTNDNHSTYYYNEKGFSGILNKVNFYELNPYEGADIREQLGTCNTYGETKVLTRTWVGIYSGTVTNYNN